MSDRKLAYQESLLHWIWKFLHIELPQLQTRGGHTLTILNPGIHNYSDGPDFLGAEFRIGSMKWYGDVEIHWKEQDWNLHHHHEDPNFNRVVLHVIYHNNGKAGNPVLRQDQTRIHTLHLKPYLTEPLQSFLDRFNQPGALPCAGHISYISHEAFVRQLEKARESYFEQKVNDLLHWYDSALPPSRAWVRMLSIGLFDGLGIAHNRESMQKLCRQLIPYLPDTPSRSECIDRAISISEINSSAPSRNYTWKHKSCRPANHPAVRIRQAGECLWFTDRLPFGQWLSKDSAQLWKQMIMQVQTRPGLGRERAGILFGTVWLPAFFILGNLFGSNSISSTAYNRWLNHHVKLPSSLLHTFESLDIPTGIYQNNLGAVFQLRTYCKPRKCEGCEVFKSVISS